MITIDPQGTLSKEFVDGGSLGLHRGKVFVVIVYPRPHGGGGNLQAVGGRGVVLHDVRGRGGGICGTPVSHRVERGGHNMLVIF